MDLQRQWALEMMAAQTALNLAKVGASELAHWLRLSSLGRGVSQAPGAGFDGHRE